MLIRYGYEITVNCWQPTAMVLQLTVRDDRGVEAEQAEVFSTDPQVDSSIYRDLFGNICRRLVAPAGDFTFRSESLLRHSGELDPVQLDAPQHPVAELPDECLVFLMGSRYCETDKLSQVAWDRFGRIEPGWGRVQAICDFVHERIAFDYQNASSTRTAFEAYEERTGVCRDYAHLAIALCRAMNIPTRYVNGYLPDIGVPKVDPMDFAAWIEVYLGDRWWTFDPRNNVPRIGRIVISQGRDAADVAMVSSFGPHILNHFNVIASEVTASAADAA